MEQIPNCFYRVSAKALIKNKANNKILLILEKNGFYDLPGGGLDFNEEPKNGLKRELLEELGLKDIKISNNPIGFISMKKWDKEFYIAQVLYEGFYKDKDISVNIDFKDNDEENESIGFYSEDEIEKMNTYPNVKEFIKQIRDNH